MKKSILLIAVILLTFFSLTAQETKKEHSIKVIGTAEMEIVPDEIFVSVTLREYTKDKRKYTIEELEKNLVNFIEKVTATEKKDIQMNTMDAYLISMKRKKNKDEMISKNYNVKFKNSQQVGQLFSVMDSLAISNAYINKYSHTKMEEYKKQIKINAINAAKDKALYLLSAIGEKAGKAISINEPNGFVEIEDGLGSRDHYGRKSNSYSQSYANMRFIGEEEALPDNGISQKTIKLHYSIHAEFEILP